MAAEVAALEVVAAEVAAMGGVGARAATVLPGEVASARVVARAAAVRAVSPAAVAVMKEVGSDEVAQSHTFRYPLHTDHQTQTNGRVAHCLL